MPFLIRKQVTQQNWWLLALAGVGAMIFGLAIILWPKPSLAIFVSLFGVSAVVYGIFTMCVGFTTRPKLLGWWLLPLGGFLSIVVGILPFVFPHTTGQFLIFLVATWAILMGIIALVHAFSSAPSVTHRWLFVLAGLLSFLLGVFLLVRPGGILDVVWLIGAFSIVYGGLLLISVMFPGKAATTSQSDTDSAGGSTG